MLTAESEKFQTGEREDNRYYQLATHVRCKALILTCIPADLAFPPNQMQGFPLRAQRVSRFRPLDAE